MEDRTPIPIVIGPTASGKSALALRMAEEFDGTVINADSMQVYRDLHIITARPDAAEEARAPHRLYGVLDGAEVCTAARWREMAVSEIQAALGAGRMPILCGGTGFYIKALVEGLSPLPDIPDDVRSAARREVEEAGAVAAWETLEEFDPDWARRIEPTDRQRIARGIEVFRATGRPLSEWQATPPEGPPPGMSFRVIAIRPDRDTLYRRCDLRFDRMVADGGLDEVRTLLARDLSHDLPVMKALGVPELAAFVRGEVPLADAVESAKGSTRRYAKRQVTWLKSQIVSNLTLESQYSESVWAEIFSFIHDSGLIRR